ncbi:MAG: hypothetical protein AAB785_01560 [Patescibacteria group bacterium]
MKYQHKNLASGRWNKLSLIEQMANIGSEVYRTIKWRRKDDNFANLAFERALELFDLTLADVKNRNRLKEIARLREAFVDFFCYDNIYKTDDKFWQNYFFSFNYAARL